MTVETGSLYGPQMHLFQLEMTSIVRGSLGLNMNASSFLSRFSEPSLFLAKGIIGASGMAILNSPAGVTFVNIVKLCTLNATMQVDGTIRYDTPISHMEMREIGISYLRSYIVSKKSLIWRLFCVSQGVLHTRP